MKKEDILEKSRRSNKDEGVEYAENQGRKIGFLIFALLFVFLVTFNFFFGETSTFHAISSLFWAFSAGEAYGRYRFVKNKLYLAGAVLASITSIFSVANYVLTTLK